MLNRINEINIFSSFGGKYLQKKDNLLKTNNTTVDTYLLSNESLEFRAKFRKNQASKEFRVGEVDNIVSFFWGELYNFPELLDELDIEKSGDEVSYSQLCCLLYGKYGIEFPKKLNGIFSLILQDKIEDTFLLAVDRYGSPRPIYYSISGQLLFSSQLSMLIEMDDRKRDIDKDSLALFLKYSYIPSPRTMFKGIKKLNPGEMIKCTNDKIEIIRYIDFNVKTNALSQEEAVEQYLELLKKSISNRLEKSEGQRIGILLSGGLDSSANVAIASMLAKCDFETFGIGFENPKYDERPYALIVANHFNVPFKDYVFTGNEIEDLPAIISQIEEPYLENGLFLTYAAFKSAQDHADIIISGNCTDQLFGTGGFAGGKPIALRYLLDRVHLRSLAKNAGEFTHAPLFYSDNALFKMKTLIQRGVDFNNWFFWGFDNYELQRLCRFDVQSIVKNVFENDLSNIPLNFADYYQYSIIHQDLEHYACQNVLVKSYRLAEMFGIYERDPYLDYEMVDFLLSVEASQKREGSLSDYFFNKTKSKALHKSAMEHILPQTILNKPKQGGFVSMDLLLTDNHKRKNIFKYILNSEIINEYLDINFVNRLLHKYEDLIRKKVYWPNHRDSMANKVLYLLTLALWCNIFYENPTKQLINIKLNELLNN